MTSDERREVAARLRKLPSDIYPAINEWAKDGLFVDANLSDEADYSQIHNAVFGCFPAEHMHPGDYEELHERLADLIDPTCTVKWKHVVIDEHYRNTLILPTCSACGHPFDKRIGPPNFCPICGDRVAERGDA